MFWETYPAEVKAIIRFTDLLHVKVNNNTVSDTLQSHPDWPSLLCISDALHQWQIPNAAAKTDVDNIDELPLPFLATINVPATPVAIVANIDETAVFYYSGNYKKPVKASREEFKKKWNGIYLIAEPNELSGEKNYTTNKRNSFIKSLVPVSLILLLTGLSAWYLAGQMEINTGANTGLLLQYLIMLTGVGVSILLLWYEMDSNNPLLHKVCTGIKKGNCNAILSGKAAQVFSWLSWSEVGFFYFTGGWMALAINGVSAVSIVAWINIFALPYTVFSVYYQWRVAKQWCVLCLSVQALLLLGGINAVTNGLLTGVQNVPSGTFVYTAILYLFPLLAWYTVKPRLLRLRDAKTTMRQYLRLKFNSEVFETLLQKQKAVTIPVDGLGITLGNPQAKHEIIKVCNPYCGPCAKAHPEIEKLLENNNNVKAKIIFTATSDEKDYRAEPVKHLLAIAAGQDEQKTKTALDDWYLAEKKDYAAFANKYPLNGELAKQAGKIDAMDKWCKATDIQFTPTIFINGYQLPDAYSIGDLEYFLAE